MKQYLIFITASLLSMIFAACSDETASVSMCDCEPDEYCIGDKCYSTDSSIAPAPEENSTTPQ